MITHISVPLQDFLDILWGSKDFSIVDDSIAKILAPHESKALFHIEELETAGLYKVWRFKDWQECNTRRERLKAECNTRVRTINTIREGLVKFFGSAMDGDFITTMTYDIYNKKNLPVCESMGITGLKPEDFV